MGNVEVFFVKCLIFLVLTICILRGINGLLKSSKKTNIKYIALIVFPFFILLSMYFSGLYRIPPVNERNLEELAIAIENVENKKGDNYFLNEVTYYENVPYSNSFNAINLCTITLIDDEVTQNNLTTIEKIFSREFNTSKGEFVCSPLYSSRQDPFEVVIHDYYTGYIYYLANSGRNYIIEYDISRLIDLFLGVIYAPPVWGSSDFSELIGNFQGYSESAAYLSCENYFKDNFPELTNYEVSDLCLVADYNNDLKNKNPKGLYNSFYNPNIFPTLPEKYNDKYLLFYSDNEQYSIATSAIIFVVNTDDGKILEVIDTRNRQSGLS